MARLSFILFSVILGCCVTGCFSKENGRVITGEIRQANNTANSVWVEELLMAGMNHRAGILSPDAFKHMGFARIEVGAELKLVYNAYSGDDRASAQTAYFDCSHLTNIAGKVRYMCFTYEPGDKWVLRLYDRSDIDDAFAADKYLAEIVSQKNPAQPIAQ